MTGAARLRLNPAAGWFTATLAKLHTSAGTPDRWIAWPPAPTFVSKAGRTAVELLTDAAGAGVSA